MTEDGFEIVGRWKKKVGELDAEEIKGGHGGTVVNRMANFLLTRNLKKIKNVYKKLLQNAGARGGQ